MKTRMTVALGLALGGWGCAGEVDDGLQSSDPPIGAVQCPEGLTVQHVPLPGARSDVEWVGLHAGQVVYASGRVFDVASGRWQAPAEKPLEALGDAPLGRRQRLMVDGRPLLLNLDTPLSGEAVVLPAAGTYNGYYMHRWATWRSAAGLHAALFETGQAGLLPGSAPCPGRTCTPPFAATADGFVYPSADGALVRAVPGGAVERLGPLGDPVRVFAEHGALGYTTLADGAQVLRIEGPFGRRDLPSDAAERLTFSARFSPGATALAQRWRVDRVEHVRIVRTADGAVLWEGEGRAQLGAGHVWISRGGLPWVRVDVSTGETSEVSGVVQVTAAGAGLDLVRFAESEEAWVLPADADGPTAQLRVATGARLQCQVGEVRGVCFLGHEAVVLDLATGRVERRFDTTGDPHFFYDGGGAAVRSGDSLVVLWPPYGAKSQWTAPAAALGDRPGDVQGAVQGCTGRAFTIAEGADGAPQLTVLSMPVP